MTGVQTCALPIFKAKNDVTSKAPLELLHMDLCGPIRVQSPGGARYMFIEGLYRPEE